MQISNVRILVMRDEFLQMVKTFRGEAGILENLKFISKITKLEFNNIINYNVDEENVIFNNDEYLTLYYLKMNNVLTFDEKHIEKKK